jgi:ACS family sodium-dependent inorganic phosphate cotransporter-like MFS transporter 6/7/8
LKCKNPEHFRILFNYSISGIAGLIWATLWFSLTFEKPAYHPTISHEEKTHIEEAIGHVSHTVPSFSTIPWKAILTSKPVYAIIVANFARSWTFYLLLQNQLTYMRDVLGMKINDVSFFWKFWLLEFFETKGLF